MHGVRIIGWRQQAIVSITYQVGHSADVCTDNTETTGHGFDDAYRSVIDTARIKKDVALGQSASDQVLRHRSFELDGMLEPEFGSQAFCLLEAAVVFVA